MKLNFLILTIILIGCTTIQKPMSTETTNLVNAHSYGFNSCKSTNCLFFKSSKIDLPPTKVIKVWWAPPVDSSVPRDEYVILNYNYIVYGLENGFYDTKGNKVEPLFIAKISMGVINEIITFHDLTPKTVTLQLNTEYQTNFYIERWLPINKTLIVVIVSTEDELFFLTLEDKE
jgi:hypothetical protein